MIILLQCTDRIGLVADIAKVMADAGLNIISMREHVNVEENRFFIRIHTDIIFETEALQHSLRQILPQDAQINITYSPAKKIVVLVTKEYHCLGDILLRNYFNTLGATVQCVISNHKNLEDLSQKFNIPFCYVPHKNKSKEDFEKNILETLGAFEHDYIIFAKFMRIVSTDFVKRYPSRIINIHHSFLPAFIGANPYRQAYERGVKLIGATAHFVTEVLDDGPIIAQQIIPVNHAHTAQDMVAAGKEIEKAVLAKSLQLVFEDRVMVYKNKTVVFEN